MNTTHYSAPAAEVRRYAELQREMHDALRAQHPEWVRPNGDSPICDAYESRFEELLSLSFSSNAHMRIMPARHAEARNMVFHKHPSATHRFFIKRKEIMNKIIEPRTSRIGVDANQCAQCIPIVKGGNRYAIR